MISASSALVVIWLPQVGPTSWMVIWFWVMSNASPARVATCWLRAADSVPVCTCHTLISRSRDVLHGGVAAAGLGRPRGRSSPWVVDEVAGNWKIDPPLNSTLKFSPRTSSATTQTSRMMPEIVYHIRWRPTKLTETSPR